MESVEFRWLKPLPSHACGVLKEVRPAEFLHVAQVVAEPGGTPYATPRANEWLRARFILENQSDLPTDLREQVRIERGRWICFGLTDCVCVSMYRWVPRNPQPDSSTRMAERLGNIDAVRKFAKITDPLFAEGSPMQAYREARQRVADFAEAYGPLGYGAIVGLDEEDRVPGEEFKNSYYAEPMAYWLVESLTMRALLSLRSAIDKHRSQLAEVKKRLLGGYSADLPAIQPSPARVLDPMSAKLSEWLKRDAGFSEAQEQFYIDHFEVCRDLGVLGLILDVRGLDYAAVPLNQARNLAETRPGPRPVRDLNAVAASLEDHLAQARAELVGMLDQKLAENVMTRCICLPGSACVHMPRNLLGALYLALAQDIERPLRPIAYCSYRECRRQLLDRERIRQDANYCLDSPCKARERNARRRDKNRAS